MDFWIKFIWEVLVTGDCTQPVAGRHVPSYLQLRPRVSHPRSTHSCDDTLVTKYSNLCFYTAGQLGFSTLCRPQLLCSNSPSRKEQQLNTHTASTTASSGSPSSCLNVGGQIGSTVFSETAQPLGCFGAVRTGNLRKGFKSSFSNL